MSKTLANYGDIEAVRNGENGDGAHNLWRIDPDTGKKIGRVSSDDFLREMGQNPEQRLSSTPAPEPAPVDPPEVPVGSSVSTTTPGSIKYDMGGTRIEVHNHNEFNPHNTNRNGDIDINNQSSVGDISIEGGGAGGNGGNGDNDPGRRRGEDEPPARSPELDELQRQLDEMNQRVEELNTRINELEQQNQELQTRNQELEEENEQLRQRIDELENPPPPEGQTEEELNEARNNLTTARDELARYDIRRSGRIGDRFHSRRREDAAAYEQALQNYYDALATVAQVMIAHERAQGRNDDEIRRALTEAKYAEDEAYANRVVSLNDEEFNSLTGFRRRRAAVLRRWANISTRNKILIGLAVGVGVGAASVMTGGGLAVLAAGSAARFSLGLINHRASLRNVTPRSLEQQLARIQAARTETLGNLGNAAVDAHGNQLAGDTRDERSANTRANQRRNRRGFIIMAGGAALAGAGLAHTAGVEGIPDFGWLGGWPKHLHWPNIHWPWGGGGPGHNGAPVPYHPKKPGLNVDFSNFHPDKFHATTPHEAVYNMLHRVIEHGNNIPVHGATDANIDAIVKDMMDHHWHIASGMADPNHQNIVDVASDWADGHTQNYLSKTAEQGLIREGGWNNGSSVENWRKFMEVAAKHGVTFGAKGS